MWRKLETREETEEERWEEINWDGMLIFRTCADFLVNMSASADVLAMAKVEVDLSTIPEGKNVRFALIGYGRGADGYTGHYQMAGQACLYPSPNSGRD